MAATIHLQTPFGLSYWNNLTKMYHDTKTSHSFDFFREMCGKEHKRVSIILSDFLQGDESNRKYKMNEQDKEGWAWWKSMSDKSAVLQYYANRVK